MNTPATPGLCHQFSGIWNGILDKVRTVEVFDDYTEPHCDSLKHVRFTYHDGSVTDIVASKAIGSPDQIAALTDGLWL